MGHLDVSQGDFEAELLELDDILQAETDQEARKFLEEDLARTRKVIDIIDRGLSGKPLKD